MGRGEEREREREAVCMCVCARQREARALDTERWKSAFQRHGKSSAGETTPPPALF